MSFENVPSASISDAEQEGTIEFLFRRYLAMPAPRYTIVSHEGQAGIRCHGCCRISYDPMDVKERFCPCLQISHGLVEDIETMGAKLYGHKDHGP